MGKSTHAPQLFAPWRLIWLAGGLLALAIVTAYCNSLSAPFIFDDHPAIESNRSIRHLWPITAVLSPPADGAGVSGRPLVNLSFAINYALGGLDPRGYRLGNVAIHVAAVLLLFGLVRRTLLQPALAARFGASALLIAFSTALLWGVHALQTETVVCVVQPNELLMGLCYLATLYTFVRAADAVRRAGWWLLSIVCCVAGMACKEVMVSAPLMMLLYDRTFCAGSFAAAWRQRRPYYLGCAGGWVLLAALMWSTHDRGGTVGFGLGIGPWPYLLTQAKALVIYLQLAFWPRPLVLDYGTAVAGGLGEVWPQALAIVALLAGTAWALWRRPFIGFLGAWFFVILAPSSSFVPLVTQTIAEHRMYLPLAALTVSVMLSLNAVLGRASLPVAVALAAALGAATVQRNALYRDPIAIWEDTLDHYPANARAHDNLGIVLYRQGRLVDAIAQYEQAAHLEPNFAEAHSNLGAALLDANRVPEAIAHLERAVQLQPRSPEAEHNLGNALVRAGRVADALPHYARAVLWWPDVPEVRINLGNALVALGRSTEAIPLYQQALVLDPSISIAHNNLAIALEEVGRQADAIPHYEEALRLKPDNAECHFNLGLALEAANRQIDAIAHYTEAVRLNPSLARAHYQLAQALRDQHRIPEARQHYEQARRLQPDLPALTF